MSQLTESFLRGLKKFTFVANLRLAVAAAYLAASSFCLLVLRIRDEEFYLAALIAQLTGVRGEGEGAQVVPPPIDTE